VTSSDIYAIGLVAYRLLTELPGQPVKGRSPAGIQSAVGLGTLRAASRVVDEDAHGGAEDRARIRGGLPAARLSRLLAGDLDSPGSIPPTEQLLTTSTCRRTRSRR